MTETAASPAEFTLTAAEVAGRLGTSRSTVMTWTKRGRIPSVKTLGGQRRYRPCDIDRIAARLLEPEDAA